MWLLRLLGGFVLLACAFFLTGAFYSPLSRSSRWSDGSRPTDASRAGSDMLDAALERLNQSRVSWLETEVWQKAQMRGLEYESEGSCLAGPDHQFRLELTTRHGSAAATFFAVSDGATLWQGTRSAVGLWTDVTKVNLTQVRKVVNQAGPVADLLDEWQDAQGHYGVVALLKRLCAQISWTNKELVRRNGGTFIRLTGAWTDASTNNLVGYAENLPDALPRQCRLYLDKETLWPHRLEWRGTSAPSSGNAPLLEIEYRNPRMNRPIPSERLAHVFAFPGPRHQASDQTSEVAERILARARDLLARQPSAK